MGARLLPLPLRKLRVPARQGGLVVMIHVPVAAGRNIRSATEREWGEGDASWATTRDRPYHGRTSLRRDFVT